MTALAAAAPSSPEQFPDVLTDIPAFHCRDVEFRCWLVSDGLNEAGVPSQRYEWRSLDGTRQASRNSKRQLYWARIGHDLIGDRYTTLTLAIYAAAQPVAHGG